MSRVASLAAFILLFAAMSPLHAEEQTVSSPGDHALTFTSTYDQTQQPYRLFVPEGLEAGARTPLLLVLHGKGVDENAWFDYTPVKEAAQEWGYILAAPYGRGNYWYRGPGEQDVLDIIDVVKGGHSIDEDRVYLMGHSMGGWGTSWISLRHPCLFAAVAPMAGWTPPDLQENALYLRPFLIHDRGDDIVPVENSRTAAARYAEQGVSFQYREETGYAHGSNMIGDNFDLLFPWLDRHTRVENPLLVRFATRTPQVGRAYWLRILQLQDFPRTGTVTAEVDPERGSVSVSAEGVRKLAFDLDRLPLNGKSIFELSIGNTVQQIEKRDRFLIMTRTASGWAIDQASKAEPAPSPKVSLPWDELPTDEDQVSFTNAYGNILRDAAGADAALFERDNFRDPGRPMTRDRLLDVYCYPGETLGSFRIVGSELKNEVENNPEYIMVLPEGEELQTDRIYRVIAPMKIAAELSDTTESLPMRASEMLVRAVPVKVGTP